MIIINDLEFHGFKENVVIIIKSVGRLDMPLEIFVAIPRNDEGYRPVDMEYHKYEALRKYGENFSEEALSIAHHLTKAKELLPNLYERLKLIADATYISSIQGELVVTISIDDIADFAYTLDNIQILK